MMDLAKASDQPERLRLRRMEMFGRQDLIDIWGRVAADNPAAADALLDRIDEACSRLIDWTPRKTGSVDG
jgi:plasmid stabilization system protein ParE